MRRATPPAELDAMKFEEFDFDGEWFDAFDKPETNGMWFVWGDSGNGKTSVVLKLLKYLTSFDRKGIYNSMEEGLRKSMQDAFRRANMSEVNGKVQLVQESMHDLDIRLSKPRSADIIVLDSWQYTGMSFQQWLKFKAKHKKKLFIITSQVTGKQPKGNPAKDVMSDADLKIWVEGHRAYSKGRFRGKKGYYTNWIEGAAMYWGQEKI